METSRTGPAAGALAASLTLAAALVLATAAGAVAGGVPPAAPNRLVWPAPPAQARIRFVRTIDPQSVKGPPGLMTKVWRALVGSSDAVHMNQPYGIAVGADKKVYVADTFGGVIHAYDIARGDHATINVKGQSLVGIAAGAGRLFVTDSAAGSVMGLDLKGRTLWSLGRKFGLGRPTGITWGGDRLYVVDTLHHCVFMVSPAGAYLGAFGMHGNGPGQFNFPTNIARGADGRLYVTDTLNFRVQAFDEEGRFLGMFGTLGDGAGDFDKPKGVATDSAGHVYVVEGMNDVVQIFDTSGRLLLVFGGSGAGEGQLWLPTGITIVDDMVYVADSANRRVQVFEYLRAGQ
jgi:DNA-binding beta-propeller fold protein YncE